MNTLQQMGQPTRTLQASHGSIILGSHGNEQADRLAGKGLTQSILVLERIHFWKVIMGRFRHFGDEVLAWKNNPNISRVKELGVMEE